MVAKSCHKVKVAVFCEESQIVVKAFRKRGHEAFSYDIMPASGGHPEWHFQKDVRDLLTYPFDLIIFHPPCQFITNTGVSWLSRGGRLDYERMINLRKATEFFNLRHRFNSPKIATENPIPHKYAKWDGFGVVGIGEYDQIIQPYQFGHLERKATCLWLKGLPPLVETNNVFDEMKKLPKKLSQRIHYMSPSPERAKLRSKTFPGIAAAMAEQWG